MTYTALGRVTPTLLTFIVAAYFALRRGREPAAFWLSAYFFCVGVYNFGHLFAFSIHAPVAGYGWHMAAFIALAAVARLQVATSEDFSNYEFFSKTKPIL